MQQIAGIPFMVTVTSATAFTINYNTNQSNFTAFNTATSTGNIGSFKQILYPVLYAPNVAFIDAITLGNTTTVTCTAPHNFLVGQQIAFRISSAWGTTQLDALPNVIIPGQPQYYIVTAVTSSTVFVCNAVSSGFTAFNSNQPFLGTPGRTFAQVIAVGDQNSGSLLTNFISPAVFNGFTASTTVGVNTINGPAIAGAFINATFQGFVIGTSIAGTAAYVINWRAYLHDINT